MSPSSAEPVFVWPKRYAPDEARVHARSHLMIAAPIAVVWETLIAVAKWPQWYRFSRNIVVSENEQTLRLASRFRWTTQGIRFTTTIHDWLPYSIIGWRSVNPLICTYHIWGLCDLGTRTIVVTEETQRGVLPRVLPHVVHRKLKTAQLVWLDCLAAQVEMHCEQGDKPRDTTLSASNE